MIAIYLVKKAQITLVLVEKNENSNQIFGFFENFFEKKGFSFIRNNQVKSIYYQILRKSTFIL